MIVGLLKIMLFFFVAIVIATFLGVFKLFQRLRDISRNLNHQQPFNDTRRSQRAEDGSEVIDTRSREKANRKIFSDDEGEFVDYKEE